ncbi:hypothetical protein F2P81_013704 [Scophthalmus maximus]|uniref:E3 ubiquitin-protein ligase CHFR n=1 Tax=Scophthalmus maximus TaxID=52904 RepID=A0A6A4SN89_SCOMX|nr:hypothetical protein F2P81_013704 [Scophthalmus maximus]
MDGCRRGRPWGKLVKVDSGETVLLFNRECTVGRKKGCYLSFPASKLVSGEHCKIVQDESSGLVWLEDMSTNGTVINMSKLVKKQTHMLQNGDVIYFVYRKSEPEHNIAYVYHSIKTEQAVPQPSYDMERGAHCPAPSSEMPLSVEPVMLTKAPCDPTRKEPQPSTSISPFCIESPLSVSGPVATVASPATGRAKEDVDDLEPESKRWKKDNDRDYDTHLPHACSTEVIGAVKGSPKSFLSKPPVDGTKTDKMAETLTCVICQDLLHDCVSLQPCMHVFCAACYSGWMERSTLCPTCRCPVERIHKNHILNNLVEAYLIQHPEKCRSEEDLKSMDSKNKITQDMLQPKVERSFSDEEGGSDYLFELSDNDSDASDIRFAFSASGDVQAVSRLQEGGVLCQRPFCHMYWGCQRIGCQGCLARFSELNLTDKCLDGVLNNNNYESEILQNYLSSRGKSWRDLRQEALQGLQQASYYLADCRISANTILCLCCGLRAFKELAYKYRQSIPPSELPGNSTTYVSRRVSRTEGAEWFVSSVVNVDNGASCASDPDFQSVDAIKNVSEIHNVQFQFFPQGLSEVPTREYNICHLITKGRNV